MLNDEILYRVETDKTLRVVVPESDREHLFMKVHAGKFGGHLREVKIHSQLSRHYILTGGVELVSLVPVRM